VIFLNTKQRGRNQISLVATAGLFLLAIAGPALAQSQPSGQSGTANSAPNAMKGKSMGSSVDPELMHPEKLTEKAPDQFTVKFVTTAGDFDVQVTRAWAPQGADRFYNLVKHHFFTNASFFRVVQGFVVQFGLSDNPWVNKAWSKATIKDDPVTQSNKKGYLVFATAGPNTRTTQLFINFADNTGLDRQGFAPFGVITSGMDVVQKIYSGYGEQPDQGQITDKGKEYLDAKFPKLDKIKSATIISPAPAAHSAHSAHTGTTSTPPKTDQ
jgi:peptidyl-prolyl cis-trans isomerase A (cyclophilin A)